ncbi:PLAC8-domain-containing protein [Aulographum hederae CBS 113979]|uniref:PLAC8-domain-containing protein n=1 Tax=Aulographum hederae CBS 113979 TaxID=1176131 RepID=A0A6G1H1P9_9PEZI|nr:PLAC8-domain-containing protein [Aulographum hederae CBS 113979]
MADAPEVVESPTDPSPSYTLNRIRNDAVRSQSSIPLSSQQSAPSPADEKRSDEPINTYLSGTTAVDGEQTMDNNTFASMNTEIFPAEKQPAREISLSTASGPSNTIYAKGFPSDSKQPVSSEPEEKVYISPPHTETTSPKYAIDTPEREQSFPIEEGLQSAGPTTQRGLPFGENEEIVQNPQLRTGDAPKVKEDSEWHHGFWDCCNPVGLCCESLCCACVIAGRTHERIYNDNPKIIPSVNGYCIGCWLLTLPLMFALPTYCSPMQANRRELRHRYNIKDTNCSDCWRVTFCPFCSLVQEEKEVVWREEQKELLEREQQGYGRRQEGMVYQAKA